MCLSEQLTQLAPLTPRPEPPHHRAEPGSLQTAAGLARELALLADVAFAGDLASDLVGLIIIVVVQAVLRNRLARAAYRMWRFSECAYLVAVADSDGARVTGRLGQAASGHDGGGEKDEREAKEDGGPEGEHACALLC